MKKKLIAIVYFFVFTINIFAQLNYRFQGREVRLNVDTSMYFIQTKNEKLQITRNTTLKQQIQKGEINW